MLRTSHGRARSAAARATAFLAFSGALFSTAASAGAATPTLLLPSARLDVQRNTVTFPLHRGVSGGKTVWYILTDVSDASEAKARGLVYAPALAGVGATQRVERKGGVWNFAAAPDFAPARTFVPGPTGFPPASARPGATAPAAYSPFVRVGASAIVYNAPIVATGDAPFDVTTHTNTADRVLHVDARKRDVTLLLADGFAAGKRVLYISTEASDAGAATIERATYAPALAKTQTGARLRIYVIVNGRTQGLAAAALHGGLDRDATSSNAASLRTSRNILGGLPVAGPNGGGIYDPLWDVYAGVWSARRVSAGTNVVLTSAQAVEDAVAAKALTAPGGKPFGPAGFAVNCPVIAVYP